MALHEGHACRFLHFGVHPGLEQMVDFVESKEFEELPESKQGESGYGKQSVPHGDYSRNQRDQKIFLLLSASPLRSCSFHSQYSCCGLVLDYTSGG